MVVAEDEVLYGMEFDKPRTWIKGKRDKGKDWDDIQLGCKKDEKGLMQFLEEEKEDNDWPESMSVDEWKKIIDIFRTFEQREKEYRRHTYSAEIFDPEVEDQDFFVPRDPSSSWQLYRKKLLGNYFSPDAVQKIEDSSIQILRRLSINTEPSDPIRGLVIGNVQSGKTANMAGLMTMAADWGWNLVIILSGTIENLRLQTQKRMISDLNSAGNLHWIPLDHPSRYKSVAGQELRDLKLQPGGTARYFTVCLKVKSRLEQLNDWLHSDKLQMSRLKILLIDDEADQAGVNTGDVYSEEDRKQINRQIINLVYCRDKDAKSERDNRYPDYRYKAMNYVMYTATPYANVLNENGEGTLYPEHFIRTLDVAKSYIGPNQIFGEVAETDDPSGNSGNLNIVRNIPDKAENNQKTDTEQIKAIHKGESDDLPYSLQHAIEWFICASAAMRYHGYKKPVSMLIHTSQKQTDHRAIAMAILSWVRVNRNKLPEYCRDLYTAETSSFTKKDFRAVYPEYEHPDDEIWDYPAFNDILPYIQELTGKISPIYFDDEGALTYSKGIHLCIDNCAKKEQNEEMMHLRLAYPTDKQLAEMGYAPAFIVIGGNTLSRGLTLEGLVSTYFLRTVTQADTLMQMGRWFGYRVHYELFERIWLTEDTQNKFSMLTQIDNDLRKQIYEMQTMGKAPNDFDLAIRTSANVSWLKLTAKNKMQMSEAAEVDFTGSDTQLTVYPLDRQILDKNRVITEQFIEGLGSGRISEYNPAVHVWEKIPFEKIMDGMFRRGFHIAETSRAFQYMDLTAEWVEKQTENDILQRDWTVMVCGSQNGIDAGKIWQIGKLKIGKINRSCKARKNDRVNIGVLSGKGDYVSDITRSELSEEDWNKMQSDKNLSKVYADYRGKAHLEKVPLFLIYLIDKDSVPMRKSAKSGKSSGRSPLKAPADMVGLTMVIPGIRGVTGVTRVKIKAPKVTDDMDGDI